MSTLPIPVDSDIKIQIRQTEEIVQQLKRIADALEESNNINRRDIRHHELIEWQKHHEVKEDA